MMRVGRVFLFSLFLSLSHLAFAGQDEATAALTEILFDSDMENISYAVSNSGDIDIVFGAAVSDDQYISILRKIQSHPQINSVLASRGSVNFCDPP